MLMPLATPTLNVGGGRGMWQIVANDSLVFQLSKLALRRCV